MDIQKNNNDKQLVFKLGGEFDTITFQGLENQIGHLDGIESLLFDFEELDYISSVGLNTLLAYQNKMDAQGKMIIKNANSDIKKIFRMTGFDDILTIE